MRWLEASLRAARSEWVDHRGWSMEPALRDGDRLRIEPIVPPLVPGQIVVRRCGERLVAHRLVALDGDRAITRGDACDEPDAPVAVSALFGRVAEVRRSPWRRLLRRLGARR
jgi:hypothetical protein